MSAVMAVARRTARASRPREGSDEGMVRSVEGAEEEDGVPVVMRVVGDGVDDGE
jgi:hypothetical protein